MYLVMLAVAVAQVSPSSIPKTPLVTADGQTVKCRLIQEAHSRIPSRICRTLAEWQRIEKEQEEELRRAGKNRSECQPGNPDC